GKRAQQEAGRGAAADRHDVAPARGHGAAHVVGDDRSRLAGDRVVIRIDFDLHATNSGPDWASASNGRSADLRRFTRLLAPSVAVPKSASLSRRVRNADF